MQWWREGGVNERVSFENGLSRFENGLQHGGAQEVAWWHKRQLRYHRCLDQTGAQGGRGDAGDDDVVEDLDDDGDGDDDKVREEAEWLIEERKNVTTRAQTDVKYRLTEKVTDTQRWTKAWVKI